jgi:hypothetical protein
MELPRPIVVLLGAGATRAAFEIRKPPPPIDNDFFEIAGQIKGRGTGRLAKQVMKDVFDLYQRVTGIGLEEYYRDIEARLELSNFAKSKHRPKDWKERTHRLEELVRRVLIHTTCDFDGGVAKPLVSEIHQPILQRLKRGDTIITFNYDTVLEEALPSKGKAWTPRGGYGLNATGVTHDWSKRWFSSRELEGSEESEIELLKLHGSLNWALYSTSNVRLKHRPYVVRSRNGKPVFETTAIVPPGWHKRVDRNPYNALWRKARLQLEKCATLVVVGYSLPETDLIAKALFLEACRSRVSQNKLIKELHIADISDSVRKRIVNIFVPALGPHGNVFRYSSAKELADAWTG